MSDWKLVALEGNTLQPSIEVLHHAAQFIAMVTNTYLPTESDDSQNSLGWDSKINQFVGRLLPQNNSQWVLDVVNFELQLRHDDKKLTITLAGKTFDEIVTELKLKLTESGLDGNLLRPISQYTVPPHEVTNGAQFVKPSLAELKEWSAYYSNAKLVLEEIQKNFTGASDVRIWPHHFDSGLYIPVTRNEAGTVTQSIGIGFAIPDPSIVEPYFYVNYWSEASVDFSSMADTPSLGRWNSKDWKGFVLPSASIIVADEQERLVKSFLSESINSLLELLNRKSS